MFYPSDLTLAAAKASPIINIAGVCATSPQFTGLINEATQRLLTYGNFWGSTVRGKICTYNQCIAWPRAIGTVLALNLNRHPRQIANHWYEFMPLSPSDCHFYYGGCHGGWHSNASVIDDGMVPVFRNIPCGSALRLQTHTRLQADRGKTMTFYGIDDNGQEVMTKDALDNWVVGESVALDIPDVQTAKLYREITRITRDATTGPVDVYAINADGLLLDVAHFEPSETEPRYRHSRLGTGTCGSRSCCGGNTTLAPQVDFLAKLRFIPVVADSDIVQISNLTALKYMIQSIRTSEAGDEDTAMKLQAMAIKELNRELNDKLPLQQVPVALEAFGTAYPSMAGVGRMI